MKPRLRYALGALCFIVGALIYLLWRSQMLLGFRVLDAFGLHSTVTSLRRLFSWPEAPEWVLFSLPDALWTVSYLLITSTYYRHQPLSQRLLICSIIPALGLGSELLQACGWLCGTFDSADLVAYGLPWAVFLLVVSVRSHYKS